MQFVDLKAQMEKVRPELDRRMADVLDSAAFVLGPQVAELENELAAIAGVNHCIGVANGTDALHLALLALGVGPGDAVFVPSFTFFASAEAICLAGAEPVFVDVSENSFNINPESTLQAIARVKATGELRPRAIIAVDLFGQVADYESLERIAKSNGLSIVEDAAQSFGARANEKLAGSFGDIATTSFFPAKPLGCYGDGGAVFTDNDKLADLVRSLRVHGKGTNKYDNVRVGMNSRLDSLQAAVILSKLSVFQEELDRRNALAERYEAQLAQLVETPPVPAGLQSSWAQYTIKVRSEHRDMLQQHLRKRGVPSIVYYPKPLDQQPAFNGRLHIETDCPTSTLLSKSVLSLPIHPYLTDAQFDQIVRAVRHFFDHHAA